MCHNLWRFVRKTRGLNGRHRDGALQASQPINKLAVYRCVLSAAVKPHQNVERDRFALFIGAEKKQER